MAEERRPGPAERMEGDEPPLPAEKPFPDSPPSPDDEPLPPPTRENWVAVVLSLATAALLAALPVTDEEGWVALPVVPYFVLSAWGAFRIRPYRNGRGVWMFWFTVLLLTFAVYLLAAWDLVSLGLGDRYVSPRSLVFLGTAGVLVVIGWVPTALLVGFARRATALLVVQLTYPLALMAVVTVLVSRREW
ncbi:MAG: hypothetical protein ABFS86_02070 [Planctomycetota bacterium]